MKPLMLIIILITNIVYAGTIDPAVEDSKYLEHGTYEDGQLFCASAVAINKKWIITAAHVIKGYRTAILSNEDKAYMIKEVICSDDFKKENFGYGDIAVCMLDAELDLDSYPALYENKDEENKIGYMVGYGMTGNFKTGAKIADNKKRAGSNKIQRIERTLLVCNVSPRGSDEATELEFLIASGDSGGGLFIDGKLAGINSFVMTDDKNPDSNFNDESAHTRISEYSGWIKKVIDRKK
jgi:hypothetical protein